jgi:hypothetical protein
MKGRGSEQDEVCDVKLTESIKSKKKKNNYGWKIFKEIIAFGAVGKS